MKKDQVNARVIKKEKTSTLSGKGEIFYCLGVDDKDQLMMKIHSNSGGGFFSDEWLSVSKVIDKLKVCDPDTPITSVVLNPLFRGRSVNTPAFLTAALRAEGVLEPIEGKQRCHQLGDVEGFLARAKKLQSGKPVPKEKAPAKAKATPAKKKAAPRAKKRSS